MNVNDLTRTAMAELDYVEKNAGQNLDVKTPGGSGNYTKYARDVKHQNGLAWCQTFIAWCFYKTFGRELANRLLCGMIASASTMDVKNAFVKAGREVKLSEAKAGDIVYRSRDGGGHVGLVVGRSMYNEIITVEGNSSADKQSWNGGQVVRHVGAPWMWCVRPDYSIVPKYKPQTWYQDSRGWWYAKDEFTYAKSEWLDVNGHRYYFDADGYTVEGHQIIDGKRYYFETSGHLAGALMISDDTGALLYKEV